MDESGQPGVDGTHFCISGASGRRRRWTRQEDDRLRFLGELGWSPARIAGDLRRSLVSVYWRAGVVYGGLDQLRSGTFAVRSARQVAQLMGVSEMRVLRWIAHKHLDARRNHGRAGPGRRRRWLIPDDALLGFLHARETWMLWGADAITDTDWRREAQAIRTAAGGHWLKLVAWANEIGYAPETIVGWVRQNIVEGRKVDGAWYVWSASADAWVRRHQGWSPRQMAAQLGVSVDALRDWIARGMIDADVLVARANGNPAQYLISPAAAERFVRDRRFWMHWSADAITDRRLRLCAQHARAVAAGNWMMLLTWASSMSLTPKRAWGRVRRGEIPAMKHAGTWWVWVPDATPHLPTTMPMERRVALMHLGSPPTLRLAGRSTVSRRWRAHGRLCALSPLPAALPPLRLCIPATAAPVARRWVRHHAILPDPAG